MPWKELERRLSDGRPSNVPANANGGDSPAWSRKRQPFVPAIQRRRGSVPYAELHCHSNFSFLDGASHPEELAEEAARLGLEALAITDHDGFYGIVRFAEAARAVGLPTIFGAELTLHLPRPQAGEPAPHAAPPPPPPPPARGRPPASPAPSPTPTSPVARRACPAPPSAPWPRAT